jgi:hypothetical protein
MMMMMFSGSSSRIAFRRLAPVLSSSSYCTRASFATATPASASAASSHQHASRRQHLAAVAAVATAAVVLSTTSLAQDENHYKTYNAAQKPPPIGGELILTSPPVKEPKTGILFPVLCNGYSLAGVGVRIKWGLIQVYAIGTYFDPLAMSAIKKSSNTAAIEQALLDPTYPRTIRIVMARGLSMKKFTDSIAEALEPRMHGQDLEKYVVAIVIVVVVMLRSCRLVLISSLL